MSFRRLELAMVLATIGVVASVSAAACANMGDVSSSTGEVGGGLPGGASTVQGGGINRDLLCASCGRPDCDCPSADGLAAADTTPPLTQCPVSDAGEVSLALTSGDNKSVDSAVYARAMLAAHAAPRADVLRLDDFLNYYAAAEPLVDGLDLVVDGPGSAKAPSGALLELRTPTADPSTRGSIALTVLVDTSTSFGDSISTMRAAIATMANRLSSTSGDELAIVDWASPGAPVFVGPPENVFAGLDALSFGRSGGDPASTLLAAVNATAAGQQASDKHLVIVTDGGLAAPRDLSPTVSLALDAGVTIDAVIVAPLAGLQSAGPSEPYNQALITALTPFGGARVLVVQDRGTPNPDMKQLLGDRFFELFATSAIHVRANVLAPAILKPTALQPAPFGGADALAASAQVKLGGLPVGYGRSISFRVAMSAQVGAPEIFTSCSTFPIEASFAIGGATPHNLPQVDLASLASPSGTMATHQAIESFVNALRVGGAAFATADGRLAAAHDAAGCGGAKPSAALCSALDEIALLMHQHPMYQ